MSEPTQRRQLPTIPTGLVVALGIVIAVAFLVRNLPWHLENYDQAKQAFASLEIADGGSLWFQHTPRGDVATKPPLMAWMSLALAKGAGLPWEIAWRLPSLAATIFIVILIWRVAAQRHGQSGAVLAVAAFSLTLLTPRLSTLVRTDMVLTATILAAGLLSCHRIHSGSPWSLRARLVLAALVALSCFLKGPLIFAFLFVPLIAVAAWGRWGRRPGLRPAWPGVWPWLLGLAPFLAWLAIGVSLDDAFREQVVVREFGGRFSVGKNAVHNNQPVYFYCVHLLHKFFPWSLIVLGSLLYRPVRRRLLADDGMFYIVLWAGVALLIMSVVPSKRVDRIFPIVPLLALLAPACAEAWFLSRQWWRKRDRPAIAVIVGTAILVSGGYAVVAPILAHRENQGELAAFAGTIRSAIRSQQFRVAAVRPEQECLYLYLRGATFCAENHAAKLWARGEIDAMVISPRRLQKIEGKLQPFVINSRASSSLGKANKCEYLFLTKPRSDNEEQGGED